MNETVKTTCPYCGVGCGVIVSLDNDNNYSPGSEQSATATHFVYQLGAGGDYLVSQKIFLGLRIMAFNSNKKQYEMPWNQGEKNSFGMNSLLIQVNGNYRF